METLQYLSSLLVTALVTTMGKGNPFLCMGVGDDGIDTFSSDPNTEESNRRLPTMVHLRYVKTNVEELYLEG